jgi:hypothetical protein
MKGNSSLSQLLEVNMFIAVTVVHDGTSDQRLINVNRIVQVGKGLNPTHCELYFDKQFDTGTVGNRLVVLENAENVYDQLKRLGIAAKMP